MRRFMHEEKTEGARNKSRPMMTYKQFKKAIEEALNKRPANLERSVRKQQVLELVNREFTEEEIQVTISYEDCPLKTDTSLLIVNK